jgi:hypothetical protein
VHQHQHHGQHPAIHKNLQYRNPSHAWLLQAARGQRSRQYRLLPQTQHSKTPAPVNPTPCTNQSHPSICTCTQYMPLGNTHIQRNTHCLPTAPKPCHYTQAIASHCTPTTPSTAHAQRATLTPHASLSSNPLQSAASRCGRGSGSGGVVRTPRHLTRQG